MRSAVAFLTVLLIAVACDDDTERPRSTTEPALIVAPAADSLVETTSTVCLAYAREREAATTLKDRARGDLLLRQKVATLDAVIADACR